MIVKTILPLETYARHMGMSPAHFWGCNANTLHYDTPSVVCNEVWSEYGWQGDYMVGRHELSLEIQRAEKEVQEYLGHPIGPMYLREEHASNIYRHSPIINQFPLSLRNREVIGAGKRKKTLVEAGASVSFGDADGDSFSEEGTVVVTGFTFDPQKVRVYHPGTDIEVRPLSSVTVDGPGTTATIKMKKWLLVKPDIYEYGISAAIELTDDSNFSVTVDVYLEELDSTETSCQMTWGMDPTSCAVLPEPRVELGRAYVHSPQHGYAVASAASYDAGTQIWTAGTVPYSDPDSTVVWYMAGARTDDYKDGLSIDPIHPYLAKAVTYLATARLPDFPCGCESVNKFYKYLTTDTARVEGSRGSAFYNTVLLESYNAIAGFGSKQGELEAARLLSIVSSHTMNGGSI